MRDEPENICEDIEDVPSQGESASDGYWPYIWAIVIVLGAGLFGLI